MDIQGDPLGRVAPVRLRPYQQKAVHEIRARVVAGVRRLIIVAPTGSGKTTIAAHIIARGCRPPLAGAIRGSPPRAHHPSSRSTSPARRGRKPARRSYGTRSTVASRRAGPSGQCGYAAQPCQAKRRHRVRRRSSQSHLEVVSRHRRMLPKSGPSRLDGDTVPGEWSRSWGRLRRPALGGFAPAAHRGGVSGRAACVHRARRRAPGPVLGTGEAG